MTPLPKSTLEWMLKVSILTTFNKSKLRNGTKAFLEPLFFSIVKFIKLGFSAPLKYGANFTGTCDLSL